MKTLVYYVVKLKTIMESQDLTKVEVLMSVESSFLVTLCQPILDFEHFTTHHSC